MLAIKIDYTIELFSEKILFKRKNRNFRNLETGPSQTTPVLNTDHGHDHKEPGGPNKIIKESITFFSHEEFQKIIKKLMKMNVRVPTCYQCIKSYLFTVLYLHYMLS